MINYVNNNDWDFTTITLLFHWKHRPGHDTILLGFILLPSVKSG